VGALPSSVVCGGCGTAAPTDDPFPFRCPNASDDTDHVMTVLLDFARFRFPDGDEPNPFVRYRTLLRAHHIAVAGGLTDAAYVELVQTLDAAVARVDGRGFVVTPFARSPSLSNRLRMESGRVWVKDETGNVSGSHKARHLMGLLIYLEVVDRLEGVRSPRDRPNLAIASCGNAALAAAVVACAGGQRLQVFVPTAADPKVLAQLESLGAQISICPRKAGVHGDPAYRRFQQAVQAGALPFTCQGPSNGLAIEGCKTLGYEMVSELATQRITLDRVFVPVGGGALASATIRALQDAVHLGALRRLPRIHAVQTQAAHPLKRAYDALAQRVLRRLGRETAMREAPAIDQERADLIASQASSPDVIEELRYAATHRAEFMRPWEHEPHSIAAGIIDDETYDWLAVVGGMMASGGYPVVVSEQVLAEANEVAREATDINVDPTGSAGLAGLLQLRDERGVGPDEQVVVLFTGVQR
jgi:threonine synthase